MGEKTISLLIFSTFSDKKQADRYKSRFTVNSYCSGRCPCGNRGPCNSLNVELAKCKSFQMRIVKSLKTCLKTKKSHTSVYLSMVSVCQWLPGHPKLVLLQSRWRQYRSCWKLKSDMGDTHQVRWWTVIGTLLGCPVLEDLKQTNRRTNQTASQSPDKPTFSYRYKSFHPTWPVSVLYKQ